MESCRTLPNTPFSFFWRITSKSGSNRLQNKSRSYCLFCVNKFDWFDLYSSLNGHFNPNYKVTLTLTLTLTLAFTLTLTLALTLILTGGARCSSVVRVFAHGRWVVGSILHGVNPLSYFSFQPVLHDWCNKGRGMCYPVCGMVHIKNLAVYRKE